MLICLFPFRSSQQSCQERGRSVPFSAEFLCTSRPLSSYGRTPRLLPSARSLPRSGEGRAPPPDTCRINSSYNIYQRMPFFLFDLCPLWSAELLLCTITTKIKIHYCALCGSCSHLSLDRGLGSGLRTIRALPVRVAGGDMGKFVSREPDFLCNGSSPMAPMSLSTGQEPALPCDAIGQEPERGWWW